MATVNNPIELRVARATDFRYIHSLAKEIAIVHEQLTVVHDFT